MHEARLAQVPHDGALDQGAQALVGLLLGHVVQEERGQRVQQRAVGDERVADGDHVEHPLGTLLALRVEAVVLAVDGVREGRQVHGPQAAQGLAHCAHVVVLRHAHPTRVVPAQPQPQIPPVGVVDGPVHRAHYALGLLDLVLLDEVEDVVVDLGDGRRGGRDGLRQLARIHKLPLEARGKRHAVALLPAPHPRCLLMCCLRAGTPFPSQWKHLTPPPV